MIHGHEHARRFARRNTGIGSKLDGGGRANVEGAALGQHRPRSLEAPAVTVPFEAMIALPSIT